MKHTILAKQRGYLILIVVILIVIIGFIGLAITNMFFSSTFSAVAHYQADAALYLAEAGLEHATHKLLEPTISERLTCLNYHTIPLTNTLGAGEYSVSSAGAFSAGSSTAAALITEALNATATTIPVNNTNGYPSSGRIMIDGEYMNYATISPTSFNNVIRGVDSTLATTHAYGAPVGQYQCTLFSSGSVPTSKNPAGKRTLHINVGLQEGWVVGETAGLNYTIGHFNNPYENAWYNYNPTTGVSLYSVFMNSYADVWVVGDNGIAGHWNGNTFVTQILNPAVAYNSVYCTASNACFAVGNTAQNNTVIQNWNGLSWSKAPISGSLPDNNLKSVNCTASNNCWAVGDNANALSPYFYWWNGITWTPVQENFLTAFPYHGLFCNNSNDCWAVGASGNFAHKIGTNWANVTTGLPATQYHGVFCNSVNDCWAVGNNDSGRDLLVHWNGASWARDISNPLPVANLHAVTCTKTNDCWAVGAAVNDNTAALAHWDGISWISFTNMMGRPFGATTLRSVAMISPHSQPQAGWEENFD